MNGYFSVRNWDEFQHYKDRDPTWIKLYNRLLDDYAFGLLPDADVRAFMDAVNCLKLD